jgi:plastocyanin
MNTVSSFRVRSTVRSAIALHLICLGLALQGAFAPRASAAGKAAPSTVHVTLSEWKVSLTPPTIPAGPVVLEVTNSGTIPHALEIEGRGLEQSTSRIRPGASARLALDLRAGTYEAYCPVGRGSHKMMGMVSHLTVGDAKHVSEMPGMMHGEGHAMEADPAGGPKGMKLVGGGPVIQILPGPFPFADSAAVVIRDRPPDQQADLTKKSHMGPYSNNVATIAGTISLVAIDRGATGDSVSGVAEFTLEDGARWKVVMDRVQTKDIPFNPRFGGVVMGLFYHGASGVHTPLVPTIQSSLALWAFAHLYKNDQLVTDNAMVHVMLLSRTRRPGDWSLDCWDCADRPVEELQLQVTSAPDTPAISAPGGFLFVNWEKSSGTAVAL